MTVRVFRLTTGEDIIGEGIDSATDLGERIVRIDQRNQPISS
mgnify:CR=1 FL=1